MIGEAIRGGFSKIPGGSLIAAAASIAGQAFLSSVCGEQAVALSPTRARVDEGKRLLKTVPVQTPGTQKFTFVDPDNKLAIAR